MKRYPALSVFVVWLAAAAAASAQEAITIKLKERGEGEPATIKKKETARTKLKVADADGNVVVDKDDAKTDVYEFTETALKRKSGKSATKLERTYSKAQTIADGETTDSSLRGKTVIIEKKEGGYDFTYKNGDEVTGAALKALEKEFGHRSEDDSELQKLVLPKGAVKVGDSWKIEMPKIIEQISKGGEMALDAGKSTGKGTLVKTYKKDGQLYGVMKFKLDVPVMTIGKGNEQLKFNAGARILLEVTMDACIDGSVDAGSMKMKMTMSGVAPVGADATATLEVIVDAEETETPVPAKK